MTLRDSAVHHYNALLAKCRKEGDIAEASRLRDVFLSQRGRGFHGPHLVSSLVTLGSMDCARKVFEAMELKDALSWNTLIIGYAKHDEPEHALSLYQRMNQVQNHSLRLSDRAFVALFKACASVRDPNAGHSLHVEAAKLGVPNLNPFVACSLVDMYAKCGYIYTAHEMFRSLPFQDTVSWNALIGGYAELGYGENALECFNQMQHEGVPADAVTFMCSLKACGSTGNIPQGEAIHDELVTKGLESNKSISNMLVDMYTRCGMLASAKGVFDKISGRDIVACNAILNGLVERGLWKEISAIVQQMEDDGNSLASITYIYLLRACSRLCISEEGQEIHAKIVTRGLEREQLLGSSLVDMYSKCGLLLEARNVLLCLSNRGVAAWTALMAGYAEHGHDQELLACFEQMWNDGILPDAPALSCGLDACGSIRATQLGQSLHTEIAVRGLETELLVGNSLVNMYAYLGLLQTAQRVFDTLSAQDMRSLNALIVGYSEKGCGEEALRCFNQMQQRGIAINPVTFVCVLKACRSLRSLLRGRETHVQIVLIGMEQHQLVGNALINFYAKFSLLKESQAVFEEFLEKDVRSWTTLLGGFAQRGLAKYALSIFEEMKEEGIIPNLVTLVHLLTACNHAGLVRKGESYFEAISKDYGLAPKIHHYTCLIDLLGRTSHIEKAVSLIQEMPMQPDLVAWLSILGARYK